MHVGLDLCLTQFHFSVIDDSREVMWMIVEGKHKLCIHRLSPIGSYCRLIGLLLIRVHVVVVVVVVGHHGLVCTSNNKATKKSSSSSPYHQRQCLAVPQDWDDSNS